MSEVKATPSINLHDEINMNEELDIAIERVQKLDEPLLVIGLGGTGKDIVSKVKKTFAQRYVLPRDENGSLIPVPRRTDYLIIDSDTTALGDFETHETCELIVPGMDVILQKQDVNLRDYEREWVNPELNASSVGAGAGTYRQAARLMLARNYDKVYEKIKSKLVHLASVDSGSDNVDNMRINVVIAAGICGGTGSGTFLDVAQIVRHCLSSDAMLALKNSKITGYLVLPDLMCAHVTAPAMQSIMKANGYAALKELDFWMNVDQHKTPYTAKYENGKEIKWDRPPYDACVLLSGVSTEGTGFRNAYDVMMQTVAENLLHYLAHEQSKEGETVYTYRNYEDNLANMVTNMPKRLPLYYGYRAVGAYTKRIPKRDIMFYEGAMLMKLFIPQRDPYGNLVSNTDLLKDGQNAVRAMRIIGDIRTIGQNVSTRVPLPAFINLPADSLRTLTPVAHQRENYAAPGAPRWEGDVLPPVMAQHAASYLDEAWTRFKDFAKAVITDPNQGPFSLKIYLENEESGLLSAMKRLLNDWRGLQNNFINSRRGRLDACAAAYPEFVRPPLLFGQRAIDTYMTALQGFYATVKNIKLMDAFVPALEKLVKRVEEYLLTALTPMCNDLLSDYTMYSENKGAATDDKLASDIYNLDQVRDQIAIDFEEQNIDAKFERQLLGKLCEESLKTIASIDPFSSGVSFPFQQSHLRVLRAELREVLNVCFKTTNSQSLDVIMEQQVGSDIAAQNKYIDQVAKTLINSAKPMFGMEAATRTEDVAKFSYLSLPDDAQKFFERYQATCTNQFEPKCSAIRDHMYCTTAWDGLALYRYSMLNSIAAAYEEKLEDPKMSKGIHLVYHPKDKAYRVNWAYLPDPAPHYLFGTKGSDRTNLEYEKARDVISRAIECGLVEVDSDLQKPTYKIKLRYATPNTFKAAETLKAEVDAIPAQIDPVTGAPIPPAKQLQLLKAFMDNATVIPLEPNTAPDVVAAKLGLTDLPHNPWDEGTQAVPSLLQQAKENYKKLCDELAVTVITRYPTYMVGLNMQVDAIQYAQQKIAEIEGEQSMWDPRIAYAPNFAKLYIHGVIRPSLSGYDYIDASGEKVKVIQPHLLKDDVSNEKVILKTAAYLADLNKTHLTRGDLAFLLKEREDDLNNRAESEELTAEDLQALVDKIAKLKDLCTKDRNFYKSKRHEPGADLDRLGKVDQLYRKIMDTAEGLESTYQEFLDNM